jgi:hypothetical protein
MSLGHELVRSLKVFVCMHSIIFHFFAWETIWLCIIYIVILFFILLLSIVIIVFLRNELYHTSSIGVLVCILWIVSCSHRQGFSAYMSLTFCYQNNIISFWCRSTFKLSFAAVYIVLSLNSRTLHPTNHIFCCVFVRFPTMQTPNLKCIFFL